MKKNIDYWEGDPGDEQEKVELSAFELSEMIEQKIANGKENKPKGWKKEVNSMIDEYNNRFTRAFSRV